MGRLVVVEGLDGAGKNTLTGALAAALADAGARVDRMTFPRYEQDVHAALIRDALHGGLGDLADSVYAMAVLFALDRRGAREEIAARRDGADVLLLDRYVASNAAYGAARCHEGAGGAFVAWVGELETGRFDVPVPDLQLLLDVDVATAADRAVARAAADSARERDRYEADGDLQARCAAVYRELAAADWLAPWRTVDGVSIEDSRELAKICLDIHP